MFFAQQRVYVRMLQSVMKIADFVLGRDTIRAAYRKSAFGESNNIGILANLLAIPISILRKFPIAKKIIRLQKDEILSQIQGYSKNTLGLATNCIYSMPEVTISENRARTVNFLIPAFSMSTISAGFFGVFQLALMIAREGYNVRLVLFDNFNYDEKNFRKNIKKYPGLETLFDEVEINYIGDRYAPLKISPHDEVVATVWYSAYFAKKIMSLLKEKPFLYLIQDYEAAFYPYNSLYALAHETYNFNYHAIVSTKTLLNFMRNRVSHFNNLYLENKAIYFNNACSAKLSDKNTFLKKHNKKTKKLAFYSRPSVNRNMFELGALALIKAWQEGYFDSGHNWELYGIGIGNVEIYLSERDKLTQLPRMSLNEYEEKIGEFDICLSLMASPHPSITPFDLAGIGALVVTNSFENKGDDYFNEITDNIIVSEPTIDSIANAIKSAIKRVDDLDTRYSNANKMNYPRNWNNVWSLDHKNFVKNIFGAPNCN